MLYRYMRGETPPRFEAVASLAHAAGFSLDWMATGQGTPEGIREAPAAYDPEQERSASGRLQEIEGLLERQAALPVPTERVAEDEALRAALADLQHIARSASLPYELRTRAVRAGSIGFGDRDGPRLGDGEAGEPGQRSAQRLAEVADELEDAIREVDYRPPDLVLDGFKTAMYVNGMPRDAAVTLLQFLDAHERKHKP